LGVGTRIGAGRSCGLGDPALRRAATQAEAERQLYRQVLSRFCQAFVKLFACFVKFLLDMALAVLWYFNILRRKNLTFDENRLLSSF
jgi:hypothetical protein